jgi:hypothetical protein
MSIARVRLCLIVSLLYPMAVVLSVLSGVGGWVGGCGCPISSKVVRKSVASFAFRNTDPIYVSAADDITCFRIVLMIRMAPLVSLFLLSMLLPRLKRPPALLLASRSERYEASLCLFNNMFDAWYCNFASGLVAQ